MVIPQSAINRDRYEMLTDRVVDPKQKPVDTTADRVVVAELIVSKYAGDPELMAMLGLDEVNA